jgi:Domain of unknown function (DUF4157)
MNGAVLELTPTYLPWLSLRERIQAARGKGHSLDSSARQMLERFFGRDLSDVRVHHDAQAHHLTQATGALAFTTGADIFFRSGMYQPDTLAGLSLLTHEVTHVVQQATRDLVGAHEMLIGDAEDAFEQEAIANERLMLAHYASLRAAAQHEECVERNPLMLSASNGILIQRAIGLEIEIPVPIDKLTAAQVAQIQGYVAASQAATAAGNNPMADKVAARAAMQQNGTVPYGIIRAAAAGFRVDADHDDRVRLPDPYAQGWPPREGGRDSIMEIVIQPPTATAAAFNAAMNNVEAFVNQINLQTNNLTTRWVNAFPGVPFAPAGVPPFVADVSVGPMDYTAQGLPLAAHQPHHNFQGSIQVNIDIDLREYHDLIQWFADSDYAIAERAVWDAHNPNVDPRPMYRQIKADIREAVDAGRIITQNIFNAQTADQRSRAGNFRGLRGWITHLALYLKRGMIAPGVLGGSAKNLVPILIKSPNSIITRYGMTTYELNYFNTNKAAVMNQIFQQLGRLADVNQPLGAVDVFAADPGKLNADQLANTGRQVVPLAGTAIMTVPNLGQERTGNQYVQNIDDVPGAANKNTRGGMVAEFRSFPRFYDGPARWRALGLDFLQQATKLNARNGIDPN